MAGRVVSIGDVEIGDGRPLVLIAGPCVIESEELILEVAGRVSELATELEMPFVYKSSYLKDNRLSPGSYAGPGLESGLRALDRVKSELGVPVLSDVHERGEVAPAAEVLDAISHTIRERVRIKGEIKTLTAQGRMSGIIISLLPIALAFALLGINPQYMSELWVKAPPMVVGIPCGWIAIASGLILMAIGIYPPRTN